MKRIYLLLLVIVVTIVSCKKTDAPGSEDGSKVPNNHETAVLPETVVMTSGGETRTYTIVYVENTAKIDKITASDGQLETYIYEGDFITKKYNGTVPNGNYDNYIYANGKLTNEEQYRGGNKSDMTEVSYLGTKSQVSFNEYNNNTWEETFKIQLSYDGKGNLKDAEISAEGNAAGEASITYDSNYSPFMNVLGWGMIKFTGGAPLGDNVGFEDIMGIRNNPTKVTGNMMGDNIEVIYTYEFKDSENPKFPTKIIGTKKAGTVNSTFMAEIKYK